MRGCFFAMLNISGINSQVVYVRNRNTALTRNVYLKQLAIELRTDELSRRITKNEKFQDIVKKNSRIPIAQRD